jgi:two-component system, chemotaxis family, sensor kinase CheA
MEPTPNSIVRSSRRIRDPLTHLVRNAVDHGIEAPAVRVAAAGKPADRPAVAAGLPRERPGDGRGLATTEAGIACRRRCGRRPWPEGARVELPNRPRACRSDERVLQFIFEPGFSTAAQVTERVGTRRGHGRRAHQHRGDRRGGRHREHARRRHHGAGARCRSRWRSCRRWWSRCGSERFAIPQAAVGELDRASRADRQWLCRVRIEGLAEGHR